MVVFLYFINLFFFRCFFCLWGSLFFSFSAGWAARGIYIFLYFFFLLDEELGIVWIVGEWGVGLGYISFFSLCLYMLVYPAYPVDILLCSYSFFV